MNNINKKIAVLLAVSIAMSFVFTSCEKNEDEKFNTLVASSQQVASGITLDLYSAIPNNNEILLYNHICHLQKYPRGLVFYYDEEGHLVAKENSFMTKKDKKPDFETPDKELYYEWVDKKVKEGYTVTTVYDEKTKTYCGWLYVKPAEVKP